MKGRATISDVAKRANVSKSAACAVFARTASSVRLSPETRDRILEAARELNYQPNIMAKSLNYRKSFLVGFFFGENTWNISSRLTRAIQNACHELDYSLIVYSSGSLEEERRNLELGIKRQLDGILTVPLLEESGDNATEYMRIAKEKIPVTQIIFKLCDKLPFVGRNYRQIGREAVEHLVRQGHRRIGLLTFPNYKDPVQGFSSFHLHQGYKKAMGKAGLKEEVHPLGCGGTGMEIVDFTSGRLEGMMSADNLPTALVTGANSLAYAAMASLKKRGLRTPEDVSIISCADDLELPSCVMGRPTVFPIPFETIGKTALQKCLGLLDPPTPLETCVGEAIMEGDTTGHPVNAERSEP